MKPAERERRHRQNLQSIQHLQQLVGVGDRTRIDHEGTLIEQARMFEEEICSHRATGAGLAALARLLRLLEEGMSRHPQRQLLLRRPGFGDEPKAVVT